MWSATFWPDFCEMIAMKNTYLPLLLFVASITTVFSQQLVLKKGEIIDSLPVQDSTNTTYSLYLPTNFNTETKWPLMVVFDMDGKEKQAMSMFVVAAEKEGYILASPKMIDSLSLTKNVLASSRVIEKVANLLPVDPNRVYTAGAAKAGRFASLIPVLMDGIKGVMSIGASLANRELLNVKEPFHFIGMVNRNDFNYTSMLTDAKLLDKLKFPNQVLLFDANGEWPGLDYIQKGMELFTLDAMGRSLIPKDSIFISSSFKKDLAKFNQLKNGGDLLWAEQYLTEMMSIYGAHKNLDSLRNVQKELRRDKQYRAMNRAENAVFLKESILKEDFQYYMEEDFYTHNFNNLGWWTYQMGELQKYINSAKSLEQQMGHRLLGFVNALAEDNIDLVLSEAVLDEDALAFLYMLKTILEPDNFEYYLNTISLSAKNEDFGTSLFYLEEVLKKGFKDKEKLYGLEGTALLRITPEFNELVAKYLDDARYLIEKN
jgi:hypothetical protein